MTDWLSRNTPDFPPGDRWAYSNSNFLLAGLIAERAVGRPWSRLIDERIALPLKLTRLGPCFDGPLHEEHRLFLVRAGRIVPDLDALATPVVADGGLCASAADLALAVEALLGDDRIAAPDSMAQASMTSFGPVDYGLGVRLGDLDGRRKRGHTGGTRRTWAAVAHYPEDGVTIAVLLNTDGFAGPGAADVEARVARAVLGLPEPGFTEAALTAGQRDALSGTFEQIEEGVRSRFVRFVRGDTLFERNLGSGDAYALRHLGQGVFGHPDWNELRLVSNLDEPEGRTIIVRSGGMFSGIAYRVADP